MLIIIIIIAIIATIHNLLNGYKLIRIAISGKESRLTFMRIVKSAIIIASSCFVIAIFSKELRGYSLVAGIIYVVDIIFYLKIMPKEFTEYDTEEIIRIPQG